MCGFRCRPGFVVQGQACVSAPAPRPIWPSNHAYVTARRPRLRWALSAAAEGAEVEYCADRDCTRSLYRASATGTETTAPSPLPPGVVYWRLRGVAGGGAGTAVSPTWQMTVPPRDAPTVTHWGINFDVNGDGRTDLAVGDFNNSRVYVYLGTPSGLASSPAVTIQGLAGSGFGDGISAAGDLDGDGFGDLLIGVPRERRVYIWRGARSTLSSSPQATIDGGTAFGSTLMGVGDFNGDGMPDAVLGSPQSLVLHLGNGAGLSSTGIALSEAASHARTAFGDFNGDQRADFASLRADGRALTVYLGTSSLGGSLSPTSSNPLSAEFGLLRGAGDLDGDGRSELVASGSGQFQVFFAGSTLAPVSRTRTSAFAAVGVDAEADGYFDLFGLASNQSAMHVYRARSTGLDTTARDITLDRSRVWLYAPYAGDFNGDGYGDVAAVTFSSPGLILVSHGGPGSFGSTPTQSITLPFSGTASFF